MIAVTLRLCIVSRVNKSSSLARKTPFSANLSQQEYNREGILCFHQRIVDTYLSDIRVSRINDINLSEV